MRLTGTNGLLVAIALCLGTAALADQPLQPPAIQPTPAGPVPPSQLKIKPRFLSGTMPDTLPEVQKMERLGRFGRMVAEATVTPAGTLADITILTSSGQPKIDAAIVAALATWRLSSPVDRGGVKVATRAKFPFNIGQGPARLSGPAFGWPPGAREAFHNGKVAVTFTIAADGVPANLKLRHSSGSSLLDGSVIDGVAASRYEKPMALDGSPATFDTIATQEFSQADGGAGSYIEGLSKYTCKAFVGEQDWRAGAISAAQLNDTTFYDFMAGAVLLTPESFGWGKLRAGGAIGRHEQAWENALARCRANPGSTFLAEYRKG